MFFRLLVSSVLASLIVSASAAPASAAPIGQVTMARVRGDAVAVWNATDALAALIANKTGKEEILRALESDATAILVERAPALKDKATSLKVTVVYKRTGAISPTYQTATLEGIEMLLSVSAPLASALGGASWAADVAASKPPKPLEINVTGKLPPEIP